MKITWLGHASYRLLTDTNVKIVTDPYAPGYRRPVCGHLTYGELREDADIVLASHEHGDHNNVVVVWGRGAAHPEVIKGSEVSATPKKARDIEFRSLATWHDDMGGKMYGDNYMFYFVADGMKVCHTGDLGHRLSEEEVAKLGKVDVLLLSVGHPKRERNHFIIDTHVADALYEQLAPKVIIPGHFSNNKCSFKIAVVDEFLDTKMNVIRLDGKDISEVELNKGNLPKETQIMVLKPVY